MTGKLTTDDQTKINHQFHQDFPTIQTDSHLIYYLYITIQNLIHLNIIYIFLYHNIFWLNSTETKNDMIECIENTEYEQTYFITIQNNYDDINRPKINVHLVNKYVYITLIGVSIIELIATFICTLEKKILFSVQRNSKWKNRLRLLFIGIIFLLYLSFLGWIFFHTFITHNLTRIIFIIILSHLIILTFLDKPNLFSDTLSNSSSRIFTIKNLSRKFSSLIIINSINRFSSRSLTSIQSRKVKSLFLSLISPLRWLSVAEQNFDEHQCSIYYTKIRQEVDYLWSIILRRIALKFYRTFASFIFFDLIPYKMMETNTIPIDSQYYKILIIIFALNTFLTHSIFLFSIQFQINLHYLSNHLGQWSLKSFDRIDSIDQWSSECNTYPYGHIIKLSSKYFIALQHISNAAHPQSISHSIFYRLFNNIKYFLTIQFSLCLILIFCQFIWIISSKFGFKILISILIILNSSYTIFKIIRNRLIFDMINEYQSDQYFLTSK